MKRQGKFPRKAWDVNELALLKFCKYKDLTANQIGEVLQRSGASVAQLWMKVQAFENGVHNQGEYLTPKIQKALQLEFRIRNDAINLEHQQRWLDKISEVTHIKYYINPALAELHDKKEEAGQEPEEIEEEIEEQKVEKPLPPLMSFSISTEAVIAIVRAWKGN